MAIQNNSIDGNYNDNVQITTTGIKVVNKPISNKWYGVQGNFTPNEEMTYTENGTYDTTKVKIANIEVNDIPADQAWFKSHEGDLIKLAYNFQDYQTVYYTPENNTIQAKKLDLFSVLTFQGWWELNPTDYVYIYSQDSSHSISHTLKQKNLPHGTILFRVSGLSKVDYIKESPLQDKDVAYLDNGVCKVSSINQKLLYWANNKMTFTDITDNRVFYKSNNTLKYSNISYDSWSTTVLVPTKEGFKTKTMQKDFLYSCDSNGLVTHDSDLIYKDYNGSWKESSNSILYLNDLQSYEVPITGSDITIIAENVEELILNQNFTGECVITGNTKILNNNSQVKISLRSTGWVGCENTTNEPISVPIGGYSDLTYLGVNRPDSFNLDQAFIDDSGWQFYWDDILEDEPIS